MEGAVNAARTPQGSPTNAPAPAPAVRRIPPALRDDAVASLLGIDPGAHAPRRRFLHGAAEHDLDLSLMWGAIDGTGAHPSVGPVCFAALGTGHLAMLFVSPPASRGGPEHPRVQTLRAEAVRRAVAELPVLVPGRVDVIQGLPAKGETWLSQALADGGLRRITRLASLRRSLARRTFPAVDPETADWGGGVTVRPVADPASSPGDRARLIAALGRSYQGTLDCPELCGLRRVEDVLDSHRDTGSFDPALWWLVELEDEPEGCVLLNPNADRHTVELIYLGLSPRLRGNRLGERLLVAAMGAAASRNVLSIACAVDERNTPARRLYARLGFRETGAREAFIAPVVGGPEPAAKT